jgi:hypothetical protein
MYIRLNSAIVIMSTMLIKRSKYTRGFPVDQGEKRATRIHVYQVKFSNSNNEYNVNEKFKWGFPVYKRKGNFGREVIMHFKTFESSPSCFCRDRRSLNTGMWCLFRPRSLSPLMYMFAISLSAESHWMTDGRHQSTFARFISTWVLCPPSISCLSTTR